MLIRKTLEQFIWKRTCMTYMSTHYVGKYDWVAEWISAAVWWCPIPPFWFCLLEEQLTHIGSEVLTAVDMKNSVFCNITPWALLHALVDFHWNTRCYIPGDRPLRTTSCHTWPSLSKPCYRVPCCKCRHVECHSMWILSWIFKSMVFSNKVTGLNVHKF
jgi:hypothetical protein